MFHGRIAAVNATAGTTWRVYGAMNPPGAIAHGPRMKEAQAPLRIAAARVRINQLRMKRISNPEEVPDSAGCYEFGY